MTFSRFSRFSLDTTGRLGLWILFWFCLPPFSPGPASPRRRHLLLRARGLGLTDGRTVFLVCTLSRGRGCPDFLVCLFFFVFVVISHSLTRWFAVRCSADEDAKKLALTARSSSRSRLGDAAAGCRAPINHTNRPSSSPSSAAGRRSS